MHIATALLTSLVWLSTSILGQEYPPLKPLAPGRARRDPHSHLVPRARDPNPQDCGTWTFYAEGAASAANREYPLCLKTAALASLVYLVPNVTGRRVGKLNTLTDACYYIQCIRKQKMKSSGTNKVMSDIKFKYAGKSEDGVHRIESGCNFSLKTASVGSVCNALPYSQTFVDYANKKEGKTDTRSCDEFPMNEMDQDSFDPADVAKGNPHASLRCINAKENTAGGNQFAKFTNKGDPQWKSDKRDTTKCPVNEDMVRLDQFNIEFDLNNVDKNEVKYCQTDTDCKNDGFSFHLFMVGGTGGSGNDPQKGEVHFPMQAKADNEYRVTGDQKILSQCRVTVHRDGDDGDAGVWAKVEMADKAATTTDGFVQIGEWEENTCPRTGKTYTIGKGVSKMPQDLSFTLPTGKLDEKQAGANMKFKYGDDFEWELDSVGVSKHMGKLTGNNKEDLHYCHGKSKVIDRPLEIQTFRDRRKAPWQESTCYFPCKENE